LNKKNSGLNQQIKNINGEKDKLDKNLNAKINSLQGEIKDMNAVKNKLDKDIAGYKK